MPLEEGDPRLEYVVTHATVSLGLERAKFLKSFLNEDNLNRLEAFCDEDTAMCLVMAPNCKLEPGFPAKLANKGKSLAFLKAAPVVLTKEKFDPSVLVMTELQGAAPVEHLELLASECFLPVLSNPLNQRKWGEVATREILDKFVAFLNSTTIMCGHVKGETRLPMPPDDSQSVNVKNRVGLLEGAVITWTKQIKAVLKQDPEQALKDGQDPTPDVELTFWRHKANNLNAIFDQLQSPRIRRVLRALDLAKSTYCTTFSRLCKEVYTARLEANDNVKFLRTLEDWFDKLSSAEDFPACEDLFKPMLHVVLLIWKNSRHYNTPARLVVLMREVCNSIIEQACNYVSGETIFQKIDAEETHLAVVEIKTLLRVCGSFKATYKEYKRTADAECPANQWRIQNNALFSRLDAFLERCHDVLDFAQTVVQFTKLGRIEVGGTKGKALTASVEAIFADFNGAVERFRGVGYEILDINESKFESDFKSFRKTITELERRLGNVVCQGFDDCSTVYGRFRVFDTFDGLLERPTIQDELEKRYVLLVKAFGSDLKVVQELFLHYRDEPPVAANLPPISGALTWCRGLLDRVRVPMNKLVQLDKSVLDREEAKEVTKVYSTLKASLEEYESQKIEEWGRDVEASSHVKLSLPLLTRDEATHYISVNFDPALVRLLRETKYFLLAELQVPESALAIYAQVETFRVWTQKLDMVVAKHNGSLAKLLPVEKPLMQPYLDKFDIAAEEGLTTLNWETHGDELEKTKRDEYIAEATAAVDIVDEYTCSMKANLDHANEIMERWTSKPLLERDKKPVELIEFDRVFKKAKSERYADIKEGGKEVERMLKDTNKMLRVSNASLDWHAYIDFINNIVVDGLAGVITVSLEFFLDQIDPEHIAEASLLPMLEITLDLVEEDPRFTPRIGCTENGKGLRDISNNWVSSFFQVATLFKRLDCDGTYMREMHTDPDVCLLMAVIEDTQDTNERMLLELRGQFDELSFLWTTDREVFFKEFTSDALVETEHATYLDLAKYDTAITKYLDIAERVGRAKSPADVGWLRCNTQPIKDSLLDLSLVWKDMHTDYLRDHLVSTLDRFDSFTIQVEEGLAMPVDDGENVGNLRQVMRDILETTKAELFTMDMFPPLKECLALLRHHQVDMGGERIPSKGEVRRREARGKPDDWVPDGPPDLSKSKVVADYLDEAPQIWEGIVKSKYAKKDAIAPIKMQEEIKLKEELNAYYEEMRAFRGEFRGNAPFAHQGTAEEAYAEIDVFAKKLEDFATRAADFNKQEELFELPVSKYPELPQTLMELRLLRALWDFKAMVMFTYDGWKRCDWDAVDTDKLESQNKTILKTLRANGNNDQIIKQWQVFRDIEDAIKNMQIVLPLINDLHSDALQNRHWKALARVCSVAKVEPTAEGFSLGDMMALKLHTRVEEVQEVVETAQKEKKIEKKLADISGAWKEFQIDYRPHKATEVSLISLSEEVLEALDAHMLELQTMLGMGKFVEFFKAGVEEWQVKLSNVQSTIGVWEKVSRSWAALESIFLSSADIRASLSDVTKIFEGIDAEFKAMMQESCTEFNVINACNVDGKEQALTEMKKGLDKCQRALNEYLDVKKAIYPRFYFVSAVALLDMLANGTNPRKIMPYLGDCYDALANLIFIKDEATGEESNKTADIMVAKDRERIPMHEPFTMEGEVELYLNRLTDAMQVTLRHQMLKGIEDGVNWETSEELPRHKWCFKYPAQVVLTGSLIYWTEETEQALEELEGGKEDAVKLTYQNSLTRLGHLIQLVLGELTSGDRCKIITFITMDVHGRDVLKLMVDSKIEGPGAFMWQQQLRFYWEHDVMDVNIRICDFKTKYFYEWTGNVGRLVITALTDRCYITLTMGLRLFLGGAPAGPAGTGKTETTKDLARALALPCYVFNCSDQMNYQSMADIFRGLAQTGAWGCFDEFNRLIPEVLSVCTVQFKAVCDAIKAGASRVVVEGDEVSLDSTCGAYITMNPGYLGRSALPEGLKALFRPMTVMVPDLVLICENMLMAQGFVEAKSLASKFYGLYSLLKELLSKQLHYDWGLRAVKSVLVIAGAMKRADPDLPEGSVLLRALRDSNIPKIVKEDEVVFFGLLGDLFPGLNPPRARDETLEANVVRACEELNLDPDDAFCLKCVQMKELLDIRHCVFLMGPAAAGKSECWRILAKARELMGPELKTGIWDVNPKAVETQELYGYISMATREWKDGLLSTVMRNIGAIPDELPKWIMLDGDLDANWIESMNSVMDDNRLLTLASNERIPLKPHMRMIFEIRDLKHATPATVSRAGILYISTDEGFQWRSMVNTWILTREESKGFTAEAKAWLTANFDEVVAPALLSIRKLLFNVAQQQTTLVNNILRLLDAFCTPDMLATEEHCQMTFSFCAAWALGSALGVADDGKDYMKVFSEWWKKTFKKRISFPGQGLIFDYWLDTENWAFESWTESPAYAQIVFNSKEANMSDVTVPTGESASVSFWLEKLLRDHHCAMLAGPSGTGKTQTIMGQLKKLDAKETLYTTINMNFFTGGLVLQASLEGVLQKKTGSLYGPPGACHMVYFIDDFNLPELDKYNTQSAISLVRQHLDYGHWYDISKLAMKTVEKCQYVAALNPTAGSMEINPRLQRHFTTFNIAMPTDVSLAIIYETFLNGHLESMFNSNAALVELVPKVIKTTLNLHKDVSENFRKTAANFHYEFNIRHVAGVFQGLLMTTPAKFKEPQVFADCWVHEAYRVYGDRLVSPEDLAKFEGLLMGQAGKGFGEFNPKRFFGDSRQPLTFCHFLEGIGEEPVYDQIHELSVLQKILDQALDEYNESNAQMDLVLFEDALNHVCRITRIINNPSGHALLVGVGGSGKKSLSRLASFICGYQTSTIQISATYGINDLKTDLQEMYKKAGIKGEGVMFLFTDAEITNERFLVYLNDLLGSADIAGLYAQDEKDEVIGSVTKKAKAAGFAPEPGPVYDFFLQEVRRNLHVCLCCSPVGPDFSTRCQRFPALVNCTVIDWFQPWPEDALLSVGQRFLGEMDLGTPLQRTAVEKFMPYSFIETNELAKRFQKEERRHVYSTPKSFLEMLKLYQVLLEHKRDTSDYSIGRLKAGLQKMQETADAVAEIEAGLKITLEDAEVKKTKAEGIAEVVGKEKAFVEGETAKAEKEAALVAVIQKDVGEKQRSTAEDLAKAEPAVEAAMAALDSLDPKSLTECKGMIKPPGGVDDVFAASMVLLAGIYPNIQHKKLKVKDRSWDAAKKQCLGNIKEYIEYLKEIKVKVDESADLSVQMKEVRPLIALEHFNVETIKGKNSAAAGVTGFILNIVIYYDIVVTVEPKRKALAEANAQLEAANTKLAEVNALVKDLTEKLAVLTKELNEAMADKAQAEAAVAKGMQKLDLAQRLTSALASENERWKESVAQMEIDRNLLTGDVLLASAFISYAGPFTKSFRDSLMRGFFEAQWKAFGGLAEGIEEPEGYVAPPMSRVLNPISVLATAQEIASWNQDTLPADPVSTENGSIVSNTARWPLIIDPQLQGISWLRHKEGHASRNCQIVRLGQKDMMRKLERALESGHTIIIENLGESLDAVLAPVIQRATIKRGRTLYVKVGDSEVEFHPDFRLYLHTKLSNPHYPPEIQAETTLINFTVTQAGLSDQLNVLVLGKERADLSEMSEVLVKQQTGFKIKMGELEDEILDRLANAEGDITEDVELIEGLEETKRISTDITKKSAVAKETQASIEITSRKYKSVADRSSMLFFLMSDLAKIHSYYVYSLAAYTKVFYRGIDLVTDKPEPELDDEGNELPVKVVELNDEELAARCIVLNKSITLTTFNYLRRGLFEKDKLTVATLVTTRILVDNDLLPGEDVSYLFLGKVHPDPGNMGPLHEWMPEQLWPKIKALEGLKQFSGLGDAMHSDSDDWLQWFDGATPEVAKFPGDWQKNLSPFDRLILLRALRPDRCSNALAAWIGDVMGKEYVEQAPFNMPATYEETSPQTPTFFVLFPGVDPTPWVEELGKELGISEAEGTFCNISMGQGQEKPAEAIVERYAKNGGWVMLQNCHLMSSWVPSLERLLEVVQEGAHADFRCYISAEAPGALSGPNMPESLLQSCIKVANEAPADIKSNLTRSWAEFGQERIDASSKPDDFKACLFSLCWFHSIILGRRRFGPQGWSRAYSFNTGDLVICSNVLTSYIDAADAAGLGVPWADLRYIFGEIMYGGHITDFWDRKTNNTYLEVSFHDGLLKQAELGHGFNSPDPQTCTTAAGYLKHLDTLPAESPLIYGLHMNSEIAYLNNATSSLLSTILRLKAGGGGGGGSGGGNISAIIEELEGKLPPLFDMIDLNDKAQPIIKGKDGPYIVVLLQEAGRMNVLTGEIARSLDELRKGLLGQLNMSQKMEDLLSALAIKQVPGRNPFHTASWEKFAWPSMKGLQDWFADLILRCGQLTEWCAIDGLQTPISVWFPGLFNPTAFLTGIKQVTARLNSLALDKMATETHVTAFNGPEECGERLPEGMYIHGLFCEGAQWGECENEKFDYVEDSTVQCAGILRESKPKELLPPMPIIYVKAVQVQPSWDPQSVGYIRPEPDLYNCPVYLTTFRGPTWVFVATLKTDKPASHWVLRGVALVAQLD
mmetsp:Transcript_14602/g.45793  ORF Transcript_14602/g.45793 Transcript_14602/m.45793 type:complete len:4603 (+) Transcript_14602:85-13893(+)